MSATPENSYLQLYLFADSKTPYQPTSFWCANAQYKVDELLFNKEKSKFIPDEILLTKREFIRDNF
jgi:hypothetical protein